MDRRRTAAALSRAAGPPMRRPQVGQSLRSFCASWSHQLQNLRVSTDHGRFEFDGAEGQDLPDDLHRLARLAIAVDHAGVGLQQDLTAGGRRPETVDLAPAHDAADLSNGPCGPSARKNARLAHPHLPRVPPPGARARTSTTTSWRPRSCAPGTRSTCSAQDRAPLEIDWVDATGDWDGGALRVDVRREPVRGVVYRPDLGGLLPVYVADRYERLVAQPFADLTEAELDDYLEPQRGRGPRGGRAGGARRRARQPPRDGPGDPRPGAGGPGRPLRGQGPRLRARVHRQAVSALQALRGRGARGARAVLVGSRHTAESLWAEMDDPALPDRTRLGPPGVDVENFVPRSPAAAAAGLAALRDRLAAAEPHASRRDGAGRTRRPTRTIRPRAATSPRSTPASPRTPTSRRPIPPRRSTATPARPPWPSRRSTSPASGSWSSSAS